MSWYRNLKLRTKFLVAFALIMVLVGAQAAITKQALNEDAVAADRANRATKIVGQLWEVRAIVRGLESHFRGYLIDNTPTTLADIENDQQLYTNAMVDLRAVIGPDTVSVQTLDTLDEGVNGWMIDTLEPGLAWRQATPPAEVDLAAIAAHDSPLAERAVGDESVRTVFERGVTQAEAVKANQEQVAVAAQQRVWWVVLAFMFTVFVVCLLIALYLTSIIANPLEMIAGRIRRVGDGDFEIDKTGIDQHDEVGELANSLDATINTLRAVNAQAAAISGGRLSAGELDTEIPGTLGVSFAQMIDYLREIRTIAAALSVGDLRTTVTVRTPDDELGHSLAAMTENLRRIVADVRTVTLHVGTGTQALAEGSEESAHLATEVAAAVNGIIEGISLQTLATTEVSVAAGNIAAQVRAATQAVSDAATASEAAAALGRAGQTSVEDVAASMEGIGASMGVTTKSVEQLQIHSRQVVDIVEVIRTIADQTHLLALNAAIEAARAGEAGRGFAIVADEVKALSDEATASTRDVGRIVGDMTLQVEHVHQAMISGRTAAAGGKEAVARAGATFVSISDGIDDIATRMTDIEGAVHSIDGAVEEIDARARELVSASTSNSVAVERVAAASEQTAATADEIGATAQELAASGEQLQEAVSVFQFDRRQPDLASTIR